MAKGAGLLGEVPPPDAGPALGPGCVKSFFCTYSWRICEPCRSSMLWGCTCTNCHPASTWPCKRRWGLPSSSTNTPVTWAETKVPSTFAVVHWSLVCGPVSAVGRCGGGLRPMTNRGRSCSISSSFCRWGQRLARLLASRSGSGASSAAICMVCGWGGTQWACAPGHSHCQARAPSSSKALAPKIRGAVHRGGVLCKGALAVGDGGIVEVMAGLWL